MELETPQLRQDTSGESVSLSVSDCQGKFGKGAAVRILQWDYSVSLIVITPHSFSFRFAAR